MICINYDRFSASEHLLFCFEHASTRTSAIMARSLDPPHIHDTTVADAAGPQRRRYCSRNALIAHLTIL
jgi:hypothetical protein